MKEIKLPEIALVLLVGPSSAGKSTFARKHFLGTEVISSDYCRALVSDDENDLSATGDAFEVLNFLAAKRLKRGKLTVIDALNLHKDDRAKLVKLAKDNYALAAAIVLDTPIRKLLERHDGRTDRNFGRQVIEKHYDMYRRTLKSIKREGFGYTYVVDPEAELRIIRQPLWNNKKEETGPFDIIGDVHGCFDELQELLTKLGYNLSKGADGRYQVQAPAGRKAIFLGDLTDRGPKSPEVLRLVMDMVRSGSALCIRGNHDDKLLRYLQGKNVSLAHGLEKSVQQLTDTSDDFKHEVSAFLDGLIAHYVLDEGKLVVAHAGLPEEMHGRAAAAVRAFCLYGETTGEVDAFGLPVRHDWAKGYRGKATVVYGHTPVPGIDWLNNTLNIDTGCVFGGSLTALRYPERETVSVDSQAVYSEPIRPVIPETTTTAPQPEDDMLDISLVREKYIVETGIGKRVIVREENAVAALEVMSRFAVDPKWLVYLPPTMSPPETSGLPEYLEHPLEVFSYYRKNGVRHLICEEKHMGSRAIAIVCKDPEVAVKRFGMQHAAPGIIYTRTGRRFFSDMATETAFLEVLQKALTAADFWDSFGTDWVCLDGELLPWSSKAKDLVVNQYAAVGASASNSLARAGEVLQQALARGLEVDEMLEIVTQRAQAIDQYITSYRHYTSETEGIEGMSFAPFHILASEGKVHADQPHTWHMEQISHICRQDELFLLLTSHLLVDLEDAESVNTAVNWWTELTAAGGEGMVVKPLDFVPTFKDRLIQPAMKCRGSEYLRIVYGPEYDLSGNLERLKQRHVKAKRELALQEFALGVEALERFVRHEPLRRVHECVFGVLALESESVDPRL
ncbi:polynucleotide kinase-phosphatase [Pontibacter virosus]|uniref:Polynucleotide 3'-phosphatase /polynucleotide 5'-hydroxyl-kinase /polynucleotide 2',3'-cyclic phosphate phosphodiesterase n=1 Tax=Pontibacter virosus TaxID=1765052 RepID=A0A2U1AWR1_9BACT|nr:polynucleotide kinase-phosphatase [Pontibacter virosus]PVY40866.1 polynucleotide 3'-phosphatase /polynucleotide 5'-hydroxyl-kinase /polynucleotide 2',3'-cyclic phosphate phosphodiesterase [Pontibacter virosus]